MNPGTTVLLLSPPPAVRAWRGSLTAFTDQGAAARFELPRGLHDGMRGTLLVGYGPDGKVARVRCVGARGHARAFALAEPWRDFAVRASPRYPAENMFALVRGPRLRKSIGAVVVDLSEGGAAIRCDAGVVADEEIEIALDGDSPSPWLRCRVVSSHGRGSEETLHLAFGDLGEREQTSVAEMVATLAAHYEAA